MSKCIWQIKKSENTALCFSDPKDEFRQGDQNIISTRLMRNDGINKWMSNSVGGKMATNLYHEFLI